jgi:hypothetical protein
MDRRQLSWRASAALNSQFHGSLPRKEAVTSAVPPPHESTAPPPYAVVLGSAILAALFISMIYLTLVDGHNKADFQWYQLPPSTTYDYSKVARNTDRAPAPFSFVLTPVNMVGLMPSQRRRKP